MERPAVEGGRPQRDRMLPYGRQTIEDDDVDAVVRVLRSEFLTTGPEVERFEEAFARAVGARHAVAVSSGTAALHVAAAAAGLGPGHHVVTTPMTFAATANAVLYRGATPDFADVEPDTGLLDPAAARAGVGGKTKAIFSVDYTGHPVDYRALGDLARDRGLLFVSDAAHALGAEYGGRRVGTQADLTTFSTHPVKHITTGEGGVVTTNREDLAAALRLFRNHGMDRSVAQRRGPSGAYAYEIVELGYNYRLTDFQAALGTSQLNKLDRFLAARERIAARYRAALSDLQALRLPVVRPGVRHAWHLYVVRLDPDRLRVGRDRIFEALRAENVGAHVHYIPVHLHPLYRRRKATPPGPLPVVEALHPQILTLPLHPGMTAADVEDVTSAVRKVVSWYAA